MFDEYFENRVNIFMYQYMYTLEELLNLEKSYFNYSEIFIDEANVDRPLKLFVKGVIERYNNVDAKNIMISLDGMSSFYQKSYLDDIYIEKVYLTEDMDTEVKNLIKKEDKVYTNPDILLKISNGTDFIYRSIELKSGKNHSIIGSSVQQFDGDEWVIFLNNKKGELEFITGQSIYSVGSKLIFPDRSPRPKVSFKELKNWNTLNRIYKNDCITYNINESENKKKKKQFKDWHNILIEDWMNICFFESDNKTWYNGVLKRFIIEFLTTYDKMSEKEKREFKHKLDAN